MSEHTRGEWFSAVGIVWGTGVAPHEALTVRSSDKSESPICVVSPISDMDDEDIANTHLISAAPDLLELAKTVVELAESRPILKSVAGGSFYKQAKAALAKAKGGVQ